MLIMFACLIFVARVEKALLTPDVIRHLFVTEYTAAIVIAHERAANGA
jgi:hypothetical protein